MFSGANFADRGCAQPPLIAHVGVTYRNATTQLAKGCGYCAVGIRDCHNLPSPPGNWGTARPQSGPRAAASQLPKELFAAILA